MVDNIELFNLTLESIEDGGYERGGDFIPFDLPKNAHSNARYYSARDIADWLLRGNVNIVPGEWTPFHAGMDAVPRKMDSQIAKRADWTRKRCSRPARFLNA